MNPPASVLSLGHALRRTAKLAAHAWPWLLWQPLADLALLAGFYGWLSIPDRTGWQLTASAVALVLLFVGFCAVHAAVFVSVRRKAQQKASKPFLRVLAPFSFWMLLSAGVATLIYTFRPLAANPEIAAPPPSPALAQVVRCGLAGVFFLFLLPNLSRVSGAPQPARKTYEVLREWEYWVVAGAVLWGAVAVVRLLLAWTPVLGGLTWETVSFALRLWLALEVKAAGWIALGALCAHGYEPAGQ